MKLQSKLSMHINPLKLVYLPQPFPKENNLKNGEQLAKTELGKSLSEALKSHKPPDKQCLQLVFGRLSPVL